MRVAATILAGLAFAACGASPPASDRTPWAPVEASSGRHARNDCSRQSGAEFPGAFTSARNVVVGPLVLIGGAYTDSETVREFGGNKFPLLVKAGHTVTVRLAPDARAIAGLAYGTLPEGKTRMRDTYRSATFISCPRGKSWSRADGEEVTFWSGFVLTRMPVCLALDVVIDGGSPRRITMPLGARC